MKQIVSNKFIKELTKFIIVEFHISVVKRINLKSKLIEILIESFCVKNAA